MVPPVGGLLQNSGVTKLYHTVIRLESSDWILVTTVTQGAREALEGLGKFWASSRFDSKLLKFALQTLFEWLVNLPNGILRREYHLAAKHTRGLVFTYSPFLKKQNYLLWLLANLSRCYRSGFPELWSEDRNPRMHYKDLSSLRGSPWKAFTEHFGW